VLVPAIQDAELVGSLVVAMHALGDYSNLAEAAEHLVGIESVYQPDPSVEGLYADLFVRYRETYRNLKNIR
jgi:sugar (pentulose or hexulose) kinase